MGINGHQNSVALFLDFVRPTTLSAILEFELPKQGILVEQVLIAQGLCLQAGRPGDRLRNTMDAPRIMAEIPDLHFRPTWDKLFLKSVTTQMREKGLARHEAKRAATQAIAEMRRIGQLRMPAN